MSATLCEVTAGGLVMGNARFENHSARPADGESAWSPLFKTLGVLADPSAATVAPHGARETVMPYGAEVFRIRACEAVRFTRLEVPIARRQLLRLATSSTPVGALCRAYIAQRATKARVARPSIEVGLLHVDGNSYQSLEVEMAFLKATTANSLALELELLGCGFFPPQRLIYDTLLPLLDSTHRQLFESKAPFVPTQDRQSAGGLWSSNSLRFAAWGTQLKALEQLYADIRRGNAYFCLPSPSSELAQGPLTIKSGSSLTDADRRFAQDVFERRKKSRQETELKLAKGPLVQDHLELPPQQAPLAA